MPRNLHNNVEAPAAISSAKSVPNLSYNQDGSQNGGPHGKADKHHKKFGFHLPKVFKKSKAKRGLSGSIEKMNMSPQQIPKSNSTSAMERPKSAYVIPTQGPEVQHDIEFTDSRSRTRTPTPTGMGAAGPTLQLQGELQAKLNQRSATPTDSAVVPIRDKTESMSQLRANEAETEEAVVPFHQKGSFLYFYQIMTKNLLGPDSDFIFLVVKISILVY